jgi:hypothetical protein
MNKKLFSIIKLIAVIIVISLAAMLVLAGASLMLMPLYHPGSKTEDFVLDRLSEDIIFAKNPIKLIEDRKDWNKILLKGDTQTNCHSNKKVYSCNVKIFFILNKYRSLETIDLIIFDPYEDKHFLLRITNKNTSRRDITHKYYRHVEVDIREIEASMTDWETARDNILTNNNSIGVNDNKHDLKGTLSIYRDTLRNDGELESTLDIRYKSQGTIKTKKIFLNCKK